MSRKARKDDAPELEPAEDVQDAAGAAEVVDAGDAGAGQAGETEAHDEASGDEVAADAAAAGEVPGAADADADEADAAQPETAEEADAAGETVSDDKPDHVHAPADYELDDDDPQPGQLTPRQIAMVAASSASYGVFRASLEDGYASVFLQSDDADVARSLELFDILDLSPDLPASAIIEQMGDPAMPEAAAEALRAAYVGMQGWVKAEEARRAPPPAPLLRKGRYEKSGRVDPAPERVVSPAEAERMRRNRAASED